MNGFDALPQPVWWFLVTVTFAGVVLTLIGKMKEVRENRRGWRLWVRHPFFRYLALDSDGKWSPIDFKAHWELQRHAAILKSVEIPSAANWFTFPDWAASRREQIIRHLKEEYPTGVDFIQTEPNQALEPTPGTVTPRANEPPII